MIDFAAYDVVGKIMVVSHNGVDDFELSTLDQDLTLSRSSRAPSARCPVRTNLGLEGEAAPSYLRVDADGEWVIDIKPVEEVRLWQADFIAGTGSDALALRRWSVGARLHECRELELHRSKYHRNPGFDLLVNEIGPVDDDHVRGPASWSSTSRRPGVRAPAWWRMLFGDRPCRGCSASLCHGVRRRSNHAGQ